jgi:hypothetical protein
MPDLLDAPAVATEPPVVAESSPSTVLATLGEPLQNMVTPPSPVDLSNLVGLPLPPAPPAPNAFPVPLPPEVMNRLPSDAKVVSVDFMPDNINSATTQIKINWVAQPVVDTEHFPVYPVYSPSSGITWANYPLDDTKPLSILYRMDNNARYTLWLDHEFDSTGRTTLVNWKVKKESLYNGWGSNGITEEWTSASDYRVQYQAGTGGYYKSNLWAYAPPSKADLFRQRIRRNMAPAIIHNYRDIYNVERTAAEMRARELLKEMIGEVAFKRYLLRGFILARGGKSGTLYKIHGGHGRIESFVKDQNGKNVPHESFCIQFKDCGLPHTDGVIMRKLLVEFDEDTLHKTANICKIGNIGPGISIAQNPRVRTEMARTA